MERIWFLSFFDNVIGLYISLALILILTEITSYYQFLFSYIMVTKILLLIALNLLILAQGAEEPYKLVINTIDPEARCLDGSFPAFYVHEGGDFNKFLVFF